MAFHFALLTILRLRESLEKQELQRLQKLVADLAQIRAEIESVDQRIEAARREVVEQVSTGISGAELHAAALSEFALLQLRANLIAKREELERARKDQQARYNHARQCREILSNLRDRQLAAYQHEQNRREQRLTDELFLMRRSHRKRAEPVSSS